MQGRSGRALLYGLLVLTVGAGALGYLASGRQLDLRSTPIAKLFLPACEQPVTYSIGEFDERFGLSRAEFSAALSEAAALWNEAAGMQVFAADEEGTVSVNLVYSQYQRNAELGAAIDAEQQAYEDKRTEVDALRSAYLSLRARYAREETAFDRRVEAYDEEVAYWNARGGAPPGEYEKLQQEQIALAREQEELNALADDVNAKVRELNAAVDELNRLAAHTNAKVGVYNKHAGIDFDQGTYTEDASGKRIDIYEFTDETELKRVLAHELGHALGIGHVENPDSIMYSYNIGESFTLTEEDVAALKEVCGVE